MASAVPATHTAPNLAATHSSGPSRGGWGNSVEPGAAFRGIGRGGARGRGGRGSHRGGRPANGRGGATSGPDAVKKSPQDQAKDKGPSIPPKATASASSSNSPSSSAQNTASAKPSSRPKAARKASESKAPRKPSLGVDPAAPPAPNSSSSAQISPRTPSRRRRSHASSKASQSSTAPGSTLPRKPSLTTDSNSSRPAASKLSPAPVKDLPPHLVPHSATAPTFDIRHDIDALVERVRSVAMDRPHTPGSHIDWAGEDDDSLPDLDDWGVTSITTTDIAPNSGKGSIISPILQDTLKPLPGIIDIDIPTPSIKLHEVNGGGLQAETVGEKTLHSVSGERTPAQAPTAEAAGLHTETSTRDGATPEPPAVQISPPSSHPLHPSLPCKQSSIDGGGTSESNEVPAVSEGIAVRSIHSPTAIRPQPPRDIFSAESSPSPDRGLAASIHAAASKSLSPSNFLRSPPYSFPHTPQGGFNPSHGRAHTMGRLRPDYLSDTDRPRRGDTQAHGRNHSTPPAGSSAVHNHSRTTSRPVITGDAISKLARTLGGTPLAKRDSAKAN